MLHQYHELPMSDQLDRLIVVFLLYAFVNTPGLGQR